MIKTSIVIINWNGLEYLKECVKSIKENTKDYELIILDNGSKEKGTVKYLKDNADIHILLQTNIGFAKGNNVASMYAKGKYIVFMNNDVTVGKGWLDEMIKTFEINNKCGAVGPLGNPRYSKVNGQLYSYQQYKGQYNVDTQVEYLSGFCILLKKEVFDKIKWDEDFFMFYEDNILSYNLTKKGYTLWISVNSIVNHLKPSRTIEKNKVDSNKLMKDNYFKYLDKLK